MTMRHEGQTGEIMVCVCVRVWGTENRHYAQQTGLLAVI